MEYLDHPFDVSTRSSRRPTPLTYEHLRKWVDAVEHFIALASVGDLTEINNYLEQQATLYVSNVIQQTISQLIGEYGDGFVTIKGTEDGQLHVYLGGIDTGVSLPISIADGEDATLGAIADAIVAAGAEGSISAKLRRATQGLEDLKTLIVLAGGANKIGTIELVTGTASIGYLATGTNLIGKVQIEGPPQTKKSKPFHVNTSPTSIIIAADGTLSHHITSIMFTVAAENDITFNDEGSGLSGAMNFGGTGEPMGLTHNFGTVPLLCAAGKAFEFDLSQAQYVDGVVTYYSEQL